MRWWLMFGGFDSSLQPKPPRFEVILGQDTYRNMAAMNLFNSWATAAFRSMENPCFQMG